MRGCHLQKRKHEDEDEVWQQYPTWVTCMNSLILFNKGIFPPAEVKLSKEASSEVRRARAWAEQTAAVPMAEQLRQAEAASPPPPPPAPTPPTAAVDSERPPFDPAVLARVAQLKQGPRVG